MSDDFYTWEQLTGPGGHGWPQLGGRSVTDAIAHIKETLSGGEPPLAHQTEATGEGVLGASVQPAPQPSSPSPAPGQPQAPGSRRTWRERAQE
jgi:hypothetical protein